MTTKGFDSVPPCSYGDGAPAYTGVFGARYIDTTANQEYYYDGAAWQALGGGGAGGLPYYLGAYGVYVYGNSTNPSYYTGFYIDCTYGAYGRFKVDAYDSIINSYNGFKIASQLGLLDLAAGTAKLHSTGYIDILSTAGIYLHLPGAPGAAGSLWNNAGIVTVA